MKYDLNKHQISKRAFLKKALEDRQRRYYKGDEGAKAIKALVLTSGHTKVLFPSEVKPILTWIDCWGWTEEPAPLKYVWEHSTHPCVRGGMTSAARAAAV